MYTNNNPLRFIDPDGMEAESADGLTNEEWVENSRPGGDPDLMIQQQQEKKKTEEGKNKDGVWTVKNKWSMAFVDLYEKSVDDYIKKFEKEGKKFTCDDLALAILASFAKDHALPFSFLTGSKYFSESSKGYSSFDDFLNDLQKHAGARDFQSKANTYDAGYNVGHFILNRREDGTAHHVQVITGIVRDDNGNPIGLNIAQGNMNFLQRAGSNNPSNLFWPYSGVQIQRGYWNLTTNTYTNFTTGNTISNYSQSERIQIVGKTFGLN